MLVFKLSDDISRYFNIFSPQCAVKTNYFIRLWCSCQKDRPLGLADQDQSTANDIRRSVYSLMKSVQGKVQT